VADAHVADLHAADDVLLVDQDFLGGEAGVDLDSQALGLLRQPAAQIARGR
jgi:hypothetical protein